MKTIGDLERWLKGAGNGVMIEMRFKKGEFRVFMGGGEVKSKTLEGALENALEELRRKENGAESMRSEKTTSVPVTTPTASMRTALLKHMWAGGPSMTPPPPAHSPPTFVMTYACGAHGYYASVNGSSCPNCPPIPKP
jgi:hypothetical protein